MLHFANQLIKLHRCID